MLFFLGDKSGVSHRSGAGEDRPGYWCGAEGPFYTLFWKIVRKTIRGAVSLIDIVCPQALEAVGPLEVVWTVPLNWAMFRS